VIVLPSSGIAGSSLTPVCIFTLLPLLDLPPLQLACLLGIRHVLPTPTVLAAKIIRHAIGLAARLPTRAPPAFHRTSVFVTLVLVLAPLVQLALVRKLLCCLRRAQLAQAPLIANLFQ
jgi:hypothetical protein